LRRGEVRRAGEKERRREGEKERRREGEKERRREGEKERRRKVGVTVWDIALWTRIVCSR
jgi:hypothetical protein